MTGQKFLAAGSSLTPGAAAATGAGTAPPSPVVASGSNDARGSVTGGTGTTPAAGNLITITFGVAYAVTPTVQVNAANAATAALQPYVTSISTTGFTIALGSAPAASQANTTYAFNYQVLG